MAGSRRAWRSKRLRRERAAADASSGGRAKLLAFDAARDCCQPRLRVCVTTECARGLLLAGCWRGKLLGVAQSC